MTAKYPRISTRIPPDTLAILHALAIVQRRAVWRVVADAIAQHHLEFTDLPSNRAKAAAL